VESSLRNVASLSIDAFLRGLGPDDRVIGFHVLDLDVDEAKRHTLVDVNLGGAAGDLLAQLGPTLCCEGLEGFVGVLEAGADLPNAPADLQLRLLLVDGLAESSQMRALCRFEVRFPCRTRVFRSFWPAGV
jgi:hypothetical protein